MNIARTQFKRQISPSEIKVSFHTARLARLKELNALEVIIDAEQRSIKNWTNGFETEDNVLYSDGVTFTIRLNTTSDTSTRTILILRQWATEDTGMKIIVLETTIGSGPTAMLFDNPYQAEPIRSRIEAEQRAFVFSQIPVDLQSNRSVLDALEQFFDWKPAYKSV